MDSRWWVGVSLGEDMLVVLVLRMDVVFPDVEVVIPAHEDGVVGATKLRESW